MRRRTLLISGGGSTDPSIAAPLEVAFYNGSDIVIRKQADWQDGETPIGIVVVPGYHDRYGDGSCGIMSLVGMDLSHPETGIPVTGASQTDNISIMWAYYLTSIGNSIFASVSTFSENQNHGGIPYQTNSASTACTISWSYPAVWPYAGTATEPTSGASTAYSNDGGYVTATSGLSACDFNGIRNTVACYIHTNIYSDEEWTASIVPEVYAPAAACAGRFKTVGTKSFLDVYSGTTSNNLNYGTSASTKDNKGFWYLPAQGELCYLPRNRFEINKTILALNQKYGNVGVQLYTSNGYWSSSETLLYDEAWYMNLNDGGLNFIGKTNRQCVRAFMRL